MKILGTLLDSRLNFEHDVTKVIAKCRYILFPLRYIRKYLNTNAALKILKTQLITVLKYSFSFLVSILELFSKCKDQVHILPVD